MSLQILAYAAQMLDRDFIYRKPTYQRSPLGAHVRDGKSCVHRQTGHSRSRELNCSVECFVVVEEPAKGDNHVFAAHTAAQFAFQHNLDRPRNLPPKFAGSPHHSSVGAHDRRPNRAERPIHIRVRVGGDDEGSGHNIAALHHNLVSDARACGIEVYLMFFGKGLNRSIFLQVGLVLILDVVIEREHELPGIENLLRTNRFELAHHR